MWLRLCSWVVVDCLRDQLHTSLSCKSPSRFDKAMIGMISPLPKFAWRCLSPFRLWVKSKESRTSFRWEIRSSWLGYVGILRENCPSPAGDMPWGVIWQVALRLWRLRQLKWLWERRHPNSQGLSQILEHGRISQRIFEKYCQTQCKFPLLIYTELYAIYIYNRGQVHCGSN